MNSYAPTPLPPHPRSDGIFGGDYKNWQDSNPQVLIRIEAVYPLAYEGKIKKRKIALNNLYLLFLVSVNIDCRLTDGRTKINRLLWSLHLGSPVYPYSLP